MDFAELSQILLPELGRTLSTHEGASLLAAERSRFDQWLTVEAFAILGRAGLGPESSREKMDIALGNWGIAVRSAVTNIPCEHAKDKTSSIKKTIDSLVKDIWWLINPGQSSFGQRAILLVAYPAEHDNDRWHSLHLRRLAGELTRLERQDFAFAGGVPGVLYFGLCTDK
jgi:hypothetical protein